MSVAFLITTPYQVYHYKWIARHLPDTTALLEQRDEQRGVTEEFVAQHLPDSTIRRTSPDRLGDLDGRYRAIVCHTPVLPLTFLEHTYVIAQQYSMAKERYQYGVWRAHCQLNLMYGPYSVDKVGGFSQAVAVGNPLLDPLFQQPVPHRRLPDGPPRLLYTPTYGGLSSLPTTLAQLRHSGVQVTVKLHHAERRGLPEEWPGLRVVGPDADPVRLLREHDAVLSDYSGAAFDAVHSGLPLVVTGVVDAHVPDFERLSEAEHDHGLLAGLAHVWHRDTDLIDAITNAELLVDSAAHKEFREATLVNAGTAGPACARQIRSLCEVGEPHHFAAAQVRAATKRYITANRQLREGRPRPAPRRTDHRGGAATILRRAYRRGRRLAARSTLLRTVVRRARQARASRSLTARQHSDLPTGPAVPRLRREEVFDLLAPQLAAVGVTVAREHDQPGADVAVLGTARPQLRAALRRLGTQRPDLRVRIGVHAGIVDVRPLTDITLGDLRTAHWLEIGLPRPRGCRHLGAYGYLTVLLVEYDRDKQRYLALRHRARRVDWTSLCTARTPAAASVVHAVGRPPQEVAHPIDAVFTWVDASDPTWRQAYERYRRDYHVHNPSASNEERYLDRQELRYSLRSLWTFAPFVRHIYLVTADQHPAWLLPDHPQITVIPHSAIFPDASVLPTFNSHAIESCLHRIPGLSEHFIYFNDDVFLGREVTAGDFFTKAGLAKVRLSPTQYIYSGEPQPSAIPTDWAAYRTTHLVARDFGLVFDRRVQHVPLVLRRSVLAEIDDRYRHEVERTRHARFRSPTDVAIPSMLAQFYGIATGRAVEWHTVKGEYQYVDTGRHDAAARLQRIATQRPTFFCLNSTRHTDVSLAKQATTLHGFMAAAFPDAAGWER